MVILTGEGTLQARAVEGALELEVIFSPRVAVTLGTVTGLNEGLWLQRPVWCEPGHQQGLFGAVRARLDPEMVPGILTSGPSRFLSLKTPVVTKTCLF